MNALCTIAGLRSAAGFASDITRPDPDRAVNTVPVLRTATFALRIHYCVFVTVKAIAGIWSAAGNTDCVAYPDENFTSIAVVVLIADAVVSFIEVRVFGTVVAVTAFWPMALICRALGVTVPNIKGTIIS